MSRESWRSAILAYASPASIALLLLGFAAGLPAILVFSTLSVWLREAGVSRETIGFASWISLAYAFKWVWSPMLDQWRLPWLGRLGRRRSWLVLSQAVIALGLVGMALCNPQHNLTLLIALAVAVAFASATQDIAIDAYRLEIAEDRLQATLAASYMTGYRVAMLLASAGALFLAEWLGSSSLGYDHAAWAATYVAFALLIVPGLITSLVISEPEVATPLPSTPPRYSFNHQLAAVGLLLVLLISVPAMINALIAQAWPRATLYALFIIGSLSPMGRMLLVPVRVMLHQASQRERPARFDFVHQAVSVIVLIILIVSTTGMFQSYWGGYWPRGTMYLLICAGCLSAPGRILMGPVLTPITDFILRYRWQALLLLGLIATYRMSDTVMGVMANVFYIDQGFSKDQIASVSKLFGLAMTLLGAAFGGLLIVRFSILPILFIGGLASAATNLMFMLLVEMGANLSMLIVTISCDNFSGGLASTAFVAYLSSLTNVKFSATQYALLSSLMLLLPRLLGGYSGVMVEQLGYHDFFLVTALLGIPTLVLILWQWRRGNLPPNEAETAAVSERS
ncbi:AmpG family muropeptide MFS transporter [Stutzerimonas balearica]|uniref:AmpG family muropeptide MFS transporter n=1 Tax=Stutzerimonas balearica TaxID=74829 RepID=UPI000C63DD67|nr:AmpG family muropeptide MFS transporter [Stutzerimonas balearica]MBB61806.1 AmpG family muropeptide MFS transporter [Pseudomonas sp.]MBS4150732.1 AmpG family muropeptide MFS transporter [Stutzerimonas balearica]QIJ01977.1 AmpG family muropeptide MFS transporter [Stutzerimonas balearica]